jgi:hypothetical protein
MKHKAQIIWIAGITVVVVGLIIAGCAGSKGSQTDAVAGAPTVSDVKLKGASSGDVTVALSGSELWAQNCGLCHNTRDPKDYSDAQWSVAVMHMRIQARLTGEEERKIRQFLQASN